uniref:GST N-terminal domain-containing protein n=1 Tax=Parastrongyloides trichosuri TaxID=131310 RepID=A0A0N4ZJE3_PARTI
PPPTLRPLILVGQIGGAFGVKGEVRISAYTADPMALVGYSPLLGADGKPALTLISARPDKAGVVARVKEIATKEEADARRGQKLFVTRDALPEPEEDEFYLTDLVGLEGRDPADVVLGKVKSVQNFGADDMLEIAPAEGGPTWLAAHRPPDRSQRPRRTLTHGHSPHGRLRIVLRFPTWTGSHQPERSMADLSAFPVTRQFPPQHPDRLQLYSLPTPNGVKVSIMLEETGLAYEAHLVDIGKDETWTPEFLSLNPNNKIPAIIDPHGPGGKPLALFESGAILLYLAEKTGRFLPADPAARY